MVKRETDIVGITEGQYGFSPRYNESFIAIKTIDDKVLKDVIEYSRKNKFAFHSETSCEGENIRYRISININKQPMVKLRDFFDFMTNLEKKIEGNNVKITTTEEIVRTR